MNIRITNATGKHIYYRVLDYEGPFASFGEDRLPGMYPNTQSDFTDSDEYYSGTNTKIGDRRYTISSRYPKFSQPKSYMSNFNTGQQPTERSYSELAQNYPSTIINKQYLDGNLEGVIPSGRVRDLMLKDANCNIYIRTFGKPIIKHIHDKEDGFIDSILGSSNVKIKRSLQPNDPRLNEYETTIKVARIRETHLIMGLRYENWDFMYDGSGQRFTSQYPQDCSYIGMIMLESYGDMTKPSFPTNQIGNPDQVPLNQSPYMPVFGKLAFVGNDPTINRGGLAKDYPYAGINSLPMPYYEGPAYDKYGTYIDRLRNEAEWRKFKYATVNPNMTSYNYSDDYDKPILGYFDRRWLYSGKYKPTQQFIDKRSNYIR